MSQTPGRGVPASLGDRLFAGLLAALPQHALSRLVGRLARLRTEPVKSWQIRAFVRRYGVDLAEAAESDPAAYPTFNAFFTRALRAGARPVVAGADEVASPIDGRVSQVGEIEAGRVFQAKGRDYGLVELLGGSVARAAPFAGGGFATLYLSPRDYHRVHMPLAGRLVETVHVPGRLFAVNPPSTRAVPALFARNERVAARFETPAGPLALVLVGALFVGAIETVWGGLITPPRGRRVTVSDARDRGVELPRGAEMGRFNMGSTVILLTAPGALDWAPGIAPGAPLRTGQLLARLRP